MLSDLSGFSVKTCYENLRLCYLDFELMLHSVNIETNMYINIFENIQMT